MLSPEVLERFSLNFDIRDDYLNNAPLRLQEEQLPVHPTVVYRMR